MQKSKSLILKIAAVVLFAVILAVVNVVYTGTTPSGIDSAAPIKKCSVLPQIVSTLAASKTEGVISDTVTFAFTITNPDSTTANGVEVVALIPKVFDVVKFTTTKGLIGHNAGSNNVKTTLPTLKPGETVTVTVTARLNASAQVSMTYYIAARVRSGNDCERGQFFTNWLPVKTLQG